MSVNGLNQNVDLQQLLKLMKIGETPKSGMSAKNVPLHLSKNGSIFNAGAKQPVNGANQTQAAQTMNSVVNANASKSLANVSQSQTTANPRQNQQVSGNKPKGIQNYDFENLRGVSSSELKSLKSTLNVQKRESRLMSWEMEYLRPSLGFCPSASCSDFL